jgi:pimeloyl-ACP methyl ester carboxylesterase
VQSPITTYVASENGVGVAVHDFGGPGHPLVLVHGTGMCSRMWEPVVERLQARSVRPLAVDLRGHGAAHTPPEATFNEDRMVADLTAVCRVFELSGAWVAAHSMGGATSLLTTAALPSAFAKLWVYEPIIFPRPEDATGPSAMVEATRRRRPSFPSRQAAMERYGSRPPLDELDPAALAAYVEHGFVDEADGSVRLACSPENEARAFEQFLADGYRQLPKVVPPVLVAYGGKSEDLAGQWAPRIADALPAGTAERFDGCGHFGPFADLSRTAASLQSWFLAG